MTKFTKRDRWGSVPRFEASNNMCRTVNTTVYFFSETFFCHRDYIPYHVASRRITCAKGVAWTVKEAGVLMNMVDSRATNLVVHEHIRFRCRRDWTDQRLHLGLVRISTWSWLDIYSGLKLYSTRTKYRCVNSVIKNEQSLNSCLWVLHVSIIASKSFYNASIKGSSTVLSSKNRGFLLWFIATNAAEVKINYCNFLSSSGC
jgi:hypothetical protein